MNIKKNLLALASVAMMLTSCNNFADLDLSNSTTVNGDANNDGVEFATSNSNTYEVEPTNPSFKLTVQRKATKAATYSIKVDENESNAFVVPATVSFDENETSKDITVDMAENAVIGTQYELGLTFGSSDMNPYTSGTKYLRLNGIIVKWNLLGQGTVDDAFVFTDDDGNHSPADVLIYQRDDKKNVYRIANAFNALSEVNKVNLDGNQTQNIDLTILQPGDVVGGVKITKSDLVYFPTLNSGYYYAYYGKNIKLYHPSDLYKSPAESDYLYSKVDAYNYNHIADPSKPEVKDTIPGKIQLAPYYYMDGVGGWDYTASSGVVIYFPGYQDPYEADIESDFEWSEVFNGEFTSGLIGKTTNASLYVGKCVTTTDKCDERFAQQYGKAYKVVYPYAENYPLTFCVKNGSILLPSGTAYANQPTGLQAFGKDVYAHINASASVYTEELITLNITFTDKTGKTSFGTYDEVIENVKWNSIGTGQWTDAFVGTSYGADAVTYNVEILENSKKPGLYRVMNAYSNSTYPYAEDDCAKDGSYVVVDATDPDGVVIEKQDLGFNWGDGEMYLQSLGAYYISQGYTKEQMKGYGYLGELKNGVITLPYIKMSDSYTCTALLYFNTAAYYADTNNEFKLVLPSAVSASAKAKANKAKATAKRNFVKKFAGKKAPVKAYSFAKRKSGKAPKLNYYVKTAPKKVAR